MKKYHIGITALLFSLLFVLSLCGCELVQPDKDISGSNTGSCDSYIGVFITDHSLHGKILEAKVSANDKSEDPNQAQIAFSESGVLCAISTEKSENGEKYKRTLSNGVADIITDLKTDKDESTSTIKGTVYFKKNGSDVFYPNPVYQRPDGSIYASPADTGIAYGIDKYSLAQTINDKDRDNRYTVTIDLSFKYIDCPSGINISELHDGGRILRTTHYDINALPEKFEISEECSTVLAEKCYEGSESEYLLVSKKGSGFYVPSYSSEFFCKINYIIIGKSK